MFIKGIGRTKFGVLNKTFIQLLHEAMYNALDDAKLSPNEIDAIIVTNFLEGVGHGQLHLNSIIASLIPGVNIPIMRTEAACASGGIGVFQAGLMLDKFETILVIGAEKMTDVKGTVCTDNIAMAGDLTIDQKNGVIFPAQYAFIANEYFQRYGGSPLDLSTISLENHTKANQNDLAHFFHKKSTLEKVRESPTIASPLNLYDCSPISDGAAALIISKHKKSERDIEVIGSSAISDSISLTQREDITTFPAVKKAAKIAFTQSGLLPQDIQLVEVHNCFSIAEVIALEDLGFFQPGKGLHKLATKDYPFHLNTDGGLIGDGHPIGATGIAQIYEIVLQLRQEAGKRQVEAKTALSHNVGGVGGTAIIHIFRK